MSLLNDLKSKRQGYTPVAVISDSDEDDNISLSVGSNDTRPFRVADKQDDEAIKDEGINLGENNLEIDTNLNISIEKLKRENNQTTSVCLLITSLVIFAIIIGFLIQYQLKNNDKTEGESPVNQISDIVWETLSLPYASESVVRLQDLNDDGVLDVLHTLVRSTSPKEHFCKSINMDEPCLGAVHAVDGKNGSLLWKTNCRNDIYAMNCGNLDIDGDGRNDCLLSGRAAQFFAINSRTGEVLWSADNKQYTQYPWNFYQPQVVPDLDGDGVGEVVVAHGGNVVYPDMMLDRDAGRILLLSGKTGLSLGRYLNMSDGRETYSAITLYKRPNGALYILYGSGGETIQGSLWGISLRDLYCYVKGTVPEKVMDQVPFLGSDSYKETWGRHLQTSDVGVIEILRSDGPRGVMVPTILADMNNDGINDLIVSLFNGSYAVVNGDNLTVIWSTDFHGYQSYSNPAPGYFNDDDHLDIMVCMSYGTWPMYRQNTVAILDGRDGSTLWKTTGVSQQRMMSSPFSVQQSSHKSAFIFWLIGRRHTMQHTCYINKGYANCTDDDDGENSEDHHHKKRHGEQTGTTCSDDILLSAEAELLMIDRDSMKAPALISRVEAGTYHYELTNQPDEEDTNSELYTDTPEMSLNSTQDGTMDLDDQREGGMKYGRQKHEIAAKNGSQCSPIIAMLISTGAINDVDHDGNLDLINLSTRQTIVQDDETIVHSTLSLQRLKLRTHNLSHARVQLHSNLTVIKYEDCGKCDGRSSMELLNDGWLGYMGLHGDSIYDVGRKN